MRRSSKVQGHERALNAALFSAIMMLIVGGLYWWKNQEFTSGYRTDTISETSEAFTAIRNSNVVVTEDQANRALSDISKSKNTVSSSDRQTTLDAMRAKLEAGQ